MAPSQVLDSPLPRHVGTKGRSATLRWWRRLDRISVRSVRWLGSRRGAAILFVGLLGFAAPMLYGLSVGLPEPSVHDEFQYLTAADTYARGRLANPTHPCWKHFESFGLIQRPVYMAKNPPGQPLMLAAGQVLFGHPIYGVWLSAALAAAATCWMLQSWTRPSWALVASVAMIVAIGVSSYWSQSYWGGFVGVLGGALTLGGLRRTIMAPSVLSSALMGIGLLTLANSRLFEGLVLAIPVGVTYLVWLVRRGVGGGATTWLRGVLPLALVMAAGAAAMAVNNRAVTGSFLRLPYVEYNAQYESVSQFSFLHLKPLIPPASPRFQRYYETYELPAYQGSQRLGRKIDHLMFALTDLNPFILGPILLLPVLLLPWMGSNRWLVWAFAVVGLVMAAQVLATYQYLHYLAPIVPLVLLFVAEGLRRLRTLRRRGRMSIRLPARYIIILFLACASWGPLHYLHGALSRPASVSTNFPNNRRMIIRQLAAIPGQHIVLVRYAADYTVHHEWVYNGADIDGQPVIFAHELSPEENRSLIEYFAGRRAWLIYMEPGKPPELKPYPLPLRRGDNGPDASEVVRPTGSRDERSSSPLTYANRAEFQFTVNQGAAQH